MNYKEKSGEMDFVKIHNFCIFQRTSREASHGLGENICKT